MDKYPPEQLPQSDIYTRHYLTDQGVKKITGKQRGTIKNNSNKRCKYTKYRGLHILKEISAGMEKAAILENYQLSETLVERIIKKSSKRI